VRYDDRLREYQRRRLGDPTDVDLSEESRFADIH
jgi:hypothetical protein